MSAKYITPASYDSGMFKLEQEVTLFRLTPNHRYTFALVNTNVDDVTAHRVEQVLEDSTAGISDGATLLYEACDESSTQIFQAQVPPTGVVKVKLTGYVGNDAVTFGFDRIGEVSSTGLSSDTLLEVVGDLTDEQKQEFLPLNAEFDYIQTSDQQGFTIPPNSFGHKGGVPYFGNSPLVPVSAGQTRNFLEGINQANWLTRPLGTFTIPAGVVGNGAKYIRIDFDLILKFEVNKPAYLNYDLTLCLLTGQEFTHINSQRVGVFFMDVGIWDAMHTLNSFKGTLVLAPIPYNGGLYAAAPISNLKSETYSPGYSPGTSRIAEVDTDVILNSGLGFAEPYGEADSLTLMLVPQATYTTFTVLAQCSVTVYADYQPNA